MHICDTDDDIYMYIHQGSDHVTRFSAFSDFSMIVYIPKTVLAQHDTLHVWVTFGILYLSFGFRDTRCWWCKCQCHKNDTRGLKIWNLRVDRTWFVLIHMFYFEYSGWCMCIWLQKKSYENMFKIKTEQLKNTCLLVLRIFHHTRRSRIPTRGFSWWKTGC